MIVLSWGPEGKMAVSYADYQGSYLWNIIKAYYGKEIAVISIRGDNSETDNLQVFKKSKFLLILMKIVSHLRNSILDRSFNFLCWYI